jgi:hypothetical protein
MINPLDGLGTWILFSPQSTTEINRVATHGPLLTPMQGVRLTAQRTRIFFFLDGVPAVSLDGTATRLYTVYIHVYKLIQPISNVKSANHKTPLYLCQH